MHLNGDSMVFLCHFNMFIVYKCFLMFVLCDIIRVFTLRAEHLELFRAYIISVILLAVRSRSYLSSTVIFTHITAGYMHLFLFLYPRYICLLWCPLCTNILPAVFHHLF